MRVATAACAMLLAVAFASPASAILQQRQLYSTNFLCHESRCVNPIFPAFRLLGVAQMEEQEKRSWQCISDLELDPATPKSENLRNYRSYAGFCKHLLDYDFAVPNFVPPDSTGAGGGSIEDILETENQRAVEAYLSHSDGLGFEFLENRSPWEYEYTNPCLFRIYQMACYTYFPKCGAGSQSANYIRPCGGICKSYVNACEVQCCDEGTACVFEHKELVSKPSSPYEWEQGCRGHWAGSSTARARRASDVKIPAAVEGLMLYQEQGLSSVTTDSGSPALADQAKVVTTIDYSGSHEQATWRSKPDFTVEKQAAEDKTTNTLGLSSCNNANIPDAFKCGKRGVCVPFDPVDPTPDAFMVCKCDPQYAGMECASERKSQLVAYFLSLFGGIFGIDRFYIGHYIYGILKLLTLGGLGFWWMHDIVWIGTGPVYAQEYRLAKSTASEILPVIITPIFFILVGVYYAYKHLTAHTSRKRKLEREILNQYDIDELTTWKHKLGSLQAERFA